MNLLIIFCSSPGRASRRYCPETRGKRAPIPGAPRIDTIFPPGGPEEVCSQSDPLGGTDGSNLSPSTGESPSSHFCAVSGTARAAPSPERYARHGIERDRRGGEQIVVIDGDRRFACAKTAEGGERHHCFPGGADGG